MIHCNYCNKLITESFIACRHFSVCPKSKLTAYFISDKKEIIECNCKLDKFDLFFNVYKKNVDPNTLKRLKNIQENEDEKWTAADKTAVFTAGILGVFLDTLITQLNILKPLDKHISKIMKSKKINKFKDLLDTFSNSFRKGSSIPIDYQDFEKYGPQSIHAQYSFGHDPIRFVEGIIQTINGEYRGIDKFGNIKKSIFGLPIDSIFQAVISYVAHMISDFCNVNSLPYPGSTFLMEFGSDKIRKDISNAFRAQLYNSRIFVYQNLPCFLINIVIYSWAIYNSYIDNKKIDLFAANDFKYQTMLLASNAMVMTSNVTITGIRTIVTQNPHNLFRLNFPAIGNTIKYTIKYIKHKMAAHSA